jgi:hypothetical protein
MNLPWESIPANAGRTAKKATAGELPQALDAALAQHQREVRERTQARLQLEVERAAEKARRRASRWERLCTAIAAVVPQELVEQMPVLDGPPDDFDCDSNCWCVEFDLPGCCEFWTWFWRDEQTGDWAPKSIPVTPSVVLYDPLEIGEPYIWWVARENMGLSAICPNDLGTLLRAAQMTPLD